MRLLVIASLLVTLALATGCMATNASVAVDDIGESVSLDLPVDGDGIGRVEASLTGVGSDGVDGTVRRRWIGLDATQAVTVGGAKGIPHAELTYDDATVVLVNGVSLDLVSTHLPTLELDDVIGWPAVVDYRRVERSPHLLATQIDVQIPESWDEETEQVR